MQHQCKDQTMHVFSTGSFFLIDFQVVNTIFYSTAEAMKQTNLPLLSEQGI